MQTSEVLKAWSTILSGRAPSLSIEITKECPLRCPGCYAFDAAHLGGGTELRQLSDFKGDELVRRVLAVIDDYRPLHVSLVEATRWFAIGSLKCCCRRSAAAGYILRW